MNEFSTGYNRIFDYFTSYGTGSCEPEQLGIPGANLGGISCGLTSIEWMADTGRWAIEAILHFRAPPTSSRFPILST